MTDAPASPTPVENFTDAYVQSALQLMIVVDHMRRSIESGRSHPDADPIDVVLCRLLTETFEHKRTRPSRRDLATAARVIEWAMDTTSSEIYLVPAELEPDD